MAQILWPGAVSVAVHDGDTVALEGFTHPIPVAAGHEISRRARETGSVDGEAGS